MMQIPFWIGMSIFAIFALVAVVLGPALIISIQIRKLKSKFPVTVPGWGIRLASRPPFKADIGDVAMYLDKLTSKWAVERSVSRDKIKGKLDGLMVTWIPDDPDISHPRSVKDSFGRIVAGWHDGNNIFVVYRPDDRLADTAFGHEVGHELLELTDALADPDHKDDAAWKIVGDVDREFRL